MRLLDLEPEWLDRYNSETHGMHRNNDVVAPATYRIIHPRDEEFFPASSITLAQAQGISFFCPICFQANKGIVGTEHIMIWFHNRNVPADAMPAARWKVSGTGFGDLTIDPSIDVGPGHWHGWVQFGLIKGGIQE